MSAPAKTNSWLALGDSYTIGESVKEEERYPVQTAMLLRIRGIPMTDPKIIAVTGWTTANLISAIRERSLERNYSIVSLLIGVNNQYQGRSLDEYKKECRELVEKSIEFAGGISAHVVLISIPDYSVTPFAVGMETERISKEIDAFNQVNRSLAEECKTHYVYITGDSREARKDISQLAEDGLHYSGKQYKIWAEKLEPLIAEMLMP